MSHEDTDPKAADRQREESCTDQENRRSIGAVIRTILHDTTKYDGSLHYRFESEVIDETETSLLLYSPPGIPMESYKGSHRPQRHVLTLFCKDHYHNYCVMWNKDWSPHIHYINILLPPRWDQTKVQAVDMDLDVLRPAEESTVYVDDEDEFELHKEKFRYPQDIIQRCVQEKEAMVKALQASKGILSKEAFRWRPGASVKELSCPMMQ